MRFARKILLSGLILGAFVGLQTASSAEETFPYIGRVKTSRVNVRAAANEDSEVLNQLNRGDLVTVLSEENGWLKIEPPKGTTFWIHSKMLQDGWIKTDGVNVRSGPGTHYAAVGQVHKNTSIDVVEQKGEWMRILPPLNSVVWVNKELVRNFGTPQNYLLKLEEEKEAGEKFKEAEDFRAAELRKPMAEIQFDAILERYREIVEKFPECKEWEKAKARLSDTEAKKEVASRETEAAQMRAKRAAVRIPVAPSQPAEPAAQSTQAPAATSKTAVKISEAKIKKEEPQADPLSFMGKLRRVSRPEAPFTHQLVGGVLDSRRVCLLAAPDMNLAPYLGKKVRVWGKIVSAQDSDASGLQIERLEIVR